MVGHSFHRDGRNNDDNDEDDDKPDDPKNPKGEGWAPCNKYVELGSVCCCNDRGVEGHNVHLYYVILDYKLHIYVTCMISFFFHFEYLDNIVQ